jgi:hypothetical protein
MTATQGLILTAQNVIGKGDSNTDWQIVRLNMQNYSEKNWRESFAGHASRGSRKSMKSSIGLLSRRRDNFKNTVYEDQPGAPNSL